MSSNVSPDVLNNREERAKRVLYSCFAGILAEESASNASSSPYNRVSPDICGEETLRVMSDKANSSAKLDGLANIDLTERDHDASTNTIKAAKEIQFMSSNVSPDVLNNREERAKRVLYSCFAGILAEESASNASSSPYNRLLATSRIQKLAMKITIMARESDRVYNDWELHACYFEAVNPSWRLPTKPAGANVAGNPPRDSGSYESIRMEESQLMISRLYKLSGKPMFLGEHLIHCLYHLRSGPEPP
nr:hypothetical protein Iba_chr04fCG9020 [Ipomoea batatas]